MNENEQMELMTEEEAEGKNVGILGLVGLVTGLAALAGASFGVVHKVADRGLDKLCEKLEARRERKRLEALENEQEEEIEEN